MSPLPSFAAGQPFSADDANTLARQGVITVETTLDRNNLPAPHDGMIVFVEADATYYGRVGGAWEVLWRDTGWITSGLAISTSANFTLNSYALRRVANRVTGRIVVTFVGSNLSSDAAGDFANVNIGSLPAGWRPSAYSMPMTMERVGAAVSYGWVETGGTLRLISSSLQSAVVLATNAQYAIYLDHYID